MACGVRLGLSGSFSCRRPEKKGQAALHYRHMALEIWLPPHWAIQPRAYGWRTMLESCQALLLDETRTTLPLLACGISGQRSWCVICLCNSRCSSARTASQKIYIMMMSWRKILSCWNHFVHVHPVWLVLHHTHPRLARYLSYAPPGSGPHYSRQSPSAKAIEPIRDPVGKKFGDYSRQYMLLLMARLCTSPRSALYEYILSSSHQSSRTAPLYLAISLSYSI